MSEWKDVAQVLLGSWPSQVAGWGREAIAAYLAELKDRGLAPDEAIIALRSCEGAFPPGAGEVSRLVRVDPSVPTFDEAFKLIFGPKGFTHAHVFRRHAPKCHPLVEAFVARQGIERLASLKVDDPEWGAKHRKDLLAAWEAHVVAFDGRQVAGIASGSGDGIRRFDPLKGLGLGRPELEAGDAA